MSSDNNKTSSIDKFLKQIQALPDKLSIFGEEVSEDVIESGYTEEHHPVGFSSGNEEEPIRFFIRGSEHWIDLEKSYLEVSGTITGRTTPSGGDDASTSSDVTLTNNFLHNLFSSVHVNINDSAVTFSNDHYPYLAYIQNLLNYPQDFSSSNGKVYLWSKDNAGEMEKVDSAAGTDRRTWIRAHNKVSGILKLRSPLFWLRPYLLSFLNLDITLNRTTNHDFLFLTLEATSNFKFRIDKIVFRARKVKFVTSFSAVCEQLMYKDEELAKYALKDARIMTKTYAGYGSVLIEDNLFHGLIPSRVVVGFVENAAFSGAKAKNPFNFVHKNITEIGLTVNGVATPFNPITTNFTSKDYVNAYHQMLESMQGVQHVTNTNAVNITYDEFGEGYTLFSFDLSPDQYGHMSHHQLYNQPANVQLKFKFNAGHATDALTLIVYYELHSRMVVDSTRRVQVFNK
jgi:hypothetical protein